MNTRHIQSFIYGALLAAVSLAASSAYAAGVMLQPAGASTDMGYFNNYDPVYAIDQSGLAAGYTSGVTDLDAFAATTGTVSGGSSFNTWFSQSSTTGNFDFDLGGVFTIESFVLWVDPQGVGQSVNGFNLLADDNAAFSSPTLLGSFSASDGTGIANNATNFGQVFDFAAISASHIRMEILSNHGSGVTTGFVEAAFGATVVPVPAALWLFGSALAGLGFIRRKKA